MPKYLFLAEKPSLMKDVQSVYRKNYKEVSSRVGDIEFIALAGHMCRLIEPKEYEEWKIKWKDINLPMVPGIFKIDAIQDKRKKDILKEIKEKAKACDGIIVGTDPDVEGNGIYYLIENYLHLDKPAYRYWYDDQTEKNLLKGLLTLTDFHKEPRDVRMTESYLIRSHMDWLIGMNFTIGMSVKSNFLMKVGRVKAPTLKIVYDNCKAIDGFSAKVDYELTANYKEGFAGAYETRFAAKKEAEDFARKLGNEAVILNVEKKITKSYAPNLYTLSALQTDAGNKYGLSPSKVLDTVQSLYESPNHLVTYPRTDGAYVSTEKAKEFESLINAVKEVPELSEGIALITKESIEKAKNDKKYVNDEKAAKASHDALLPTGTRPDMSKLTDTQKKVYLLICKRFLSIFLPPLSAENTTLSADINGALFISRGKKTLDEGWTKLYDRKKEDTIIPPAKKGDRLAVSDFAAIEKKTSPPARLTQATLIEAMENVQKFITEKEYKDVLKLVHGIGMQSSRASIIDDLIKSGYMQEKGKGKGLYITDQGKAYVENLEGFSVLSPILTAQWEQKMGEIREGSLKYEEVEKEMVKYVKDTVQEIKSHKFNYVFIEKNSSGLKCPYCGKPMINGKFGYFCSGRNDGCKYKVPNEIAKKKLTEKQKEDLITKGKTGIIKGFTSKAGKSFDAALERTEDGVKFVFN